MAATDADVPTAAQDVVCVLDADLNQVFADARALKVSVKEEAKPMEHPLETGATIIDHIIFLPVTVELSMLLASQDYPGVYNQIKEFFKRGELLTVQTKTGSYQSMFIEKIPHEEDADMTDGVKLAMSLKEARFITPTFSTLKVSRPRDTSTKKRGEQQPTDTPPAAKRGSILSGLFK